MRSTAASWPTAPSSQPVLDYRGVNALAESFVDSFKTELIADRVWRSRSQLELPVVEYIRWFNHDRLHSVHDYLSPAKHEQRWQRPQLNAFPAQAATALVAGREAPAGLSALRFENPPPTTK